MLPPHELRNKTFGKAMRGYNPVEVDEYIGFLIEKYTELYRENDELERKLRAALTRLDDIKEDEDSIRSTLIDAKRAANKIKADATERAEAIIRSAKDSCNTILADFNEKIELGRETMADMQRDAFELKQELFARYSEHIAFIEKLTEGMDESAIPEASELHREAIKRLKESISGMTPTTAAEESANNLNIDAEIDSIASAYTPSDGTDELEVLDFVTTAAESEAFEVKREPVAAKGALKGSIEQLNRQYREAEDVINTPDSDIADDVSYMDFVKSVTGKSAASVSKDNDFEMLFSDDQGNKRRRK